MKSTGFSRQLYRSILIHSTMSILAVGLTVSVVSIAFLYLKIKSELTNDLVQALHVRTMTVDEFANRIRDVALQITSRSKLRQKLYEYDQGKCDRSELESFSAPLLADAMKQSREIGGISRLDAGGRLVVEIGTPIPREAWPVPGASERALMRGPLLLEGKLYIVVGASIIFDGAKRIGTDIVLFESLKLQNVLLDQTGLGKKGEAVLGIPDGGGINLLIPLMADRGKKPTVIPPLLSPTSPVAGALKKGFAGKDGITAPDSSSIIAYGPVADTGWALAVRMDKDELYAPMYREMLVMGAVTVLLILIGYYVMIIVLRPLTKGILIKAEDMEKQIHEKTAQLEASAGALEGEKKLLTKKNIELERAYADLKAAQSTILQQEKMASIGQLAAGVAHEINNPMGFIISNLNTLGRYTNRLFEFMRTQADATESSFEGTALLDQIKERKRLLKIDYIIEDTGKLISESLEGAERVKVIVQDLKNFSRVDETEWKADDINAGLESTINIIWNELKYKTVVKKEYGDVPLIECNISQLNQVFMNLLLNAAQAMEKQGEIGIKTWSDKDNVFVSVSDTGCGIPGEDLCRIFEPFFTTKEVGKGTGLGLSIAYDIVMKHEGKIEVRSELGKGSIFTVRIPVAQSRGKSA